MTSHQFIQQAVCQLFESTAGTLRESNVIFHPHLTRQVMLDLLDVAERELKVFIYPIPDHVDSYKDENPSNWQQCTGRTFELHFCIEEIFIRYLRDVRDNFTKYPHLKTNFMTHDAAQANAFIIDHTWVMKNSVDNHLRPIVNNVVDNYPYYNRSFGHDHFLVYPYDFGVLCSGRHLREDWSEIENCQVDTSVGHKYFCHVSRILNTSFIGNYGMDSRYYTENEYSFGLNKCIGASCPTVACHRPDIDIVTPQYLTTDTHDCYSDLDANKSLFVHRKFDSCFQGNYLYQRSILENMKHDNSIHYTQNNTDRFQETDDLFKCIFAYHMCGQACWSKRLYDALALGAVPIIVADGAIQAFERFLDWRQFTIKISVPELFQDKFSYRFRHILRRQSDLFRREVGQYASSPPGFVPIKSSMMGDATSLRSKGSNNKFGFVLRKMVNGRSSVEWFNFRDLQLEVNAFRMLVLEMFCRIVRRRMLRPSSPCAAASANRPEEGVRFSQMNSSSLAADPVFQCYVCSRKSDFIARMRFVR